MHLFQGCAICWAPLVHVPKVPKAVSLPGVEVYSLCCAQVLPSLSPSPAMLSRQRGSSVESCDVFWGGDISSQPPHCHQQRPKGLQSSLRCFIWLVSNKYHSPNSKFLLRTIYGQFTAWRINAITELKYFWITKLKKLCSAFRETALKKDVAFITGPLLANSFKGRK